jgi:uncharacterized protein (TIGR03083 family)
VTDDLADELMAGPAGSVSFVGEASPTEVETAARARAIHVVMTIDHLGLLASEGARILDAYRRDPDGRVPWSDRWTVRSVARHVAGSHHAVAVILSDRPTADFARAAAMPRVETSDPGFPEWFAGTTEELLHQCRVVPPEAACWAPHPLLEGTGAYWTRRIAYDTLVHRWDAEAGAGIAGPAMEPETAADAVDELLDVGVRVIRAVADAPAGPSISLASTDAHRAWHLDLGEVGHLTIRTAPIDTVVTLRGTAEALLLWLWGRVDIAAGEIEIDGDRSVVARRTELLPVS